MKNNEEKFMTIVHIRENSNPLSLLRSAAGNLLPRPRFPLLSVADHFHI
jgi:hypothetical protein